MRDAALGAALLLAIASLAGSSESAAPNAAPDAARRSLCCTALDGTPSSATSTIARVPSAPGARGGSAASSEEGAQAKTQRSDVRQIVTFLFLPGMTDSATAVYRRELRPAYVADTAMRRFRAYREVESPEPLDLIVISSFDGMEGMDASNAALRALTSSGRSVFQWYGTLSSITQHHHDQFAEMLPLLAAGGRRAGVSAGGPGGAGGFGGLGGLGVRATSKVLEGGQSTEQSLSPQSFDPPSDRNSSPLLVIEYTRAAPGARRAYESFVTTSLRPIEESSPGLRWSETGRLLLSDGWDYVRFYGIASLGAWHTYQSQLRRSGAATRADRLVAARKTIVVREQGALAVR